jgi:hypothetical protein
MDWLKMLAIAGMNGGGSGGSGGGVSSWNDLTDKPFGEMEMYLIPETDFTFTNEQLGFLGYAEMTSVNMTVGELYRVTWDGVEYAREAKEANGMVYVGNASAMGAEDTGEPFLVTISSGMLMICPMPLNSATQAKVSVLGRSTKRMESKFVSRPWYNFTELGLPQLPGDGTMVECTIGTTKAQEIINSLLYDGANISFRTAIDVDFGESELGEKGWGTRMVTNPTCVGDLSRLYIVVRHCEDEYWFLIDVMDGLIQAFIKPGSEPGTYNADLKKLNKTVLLEAGISEKNIDVTDVCTCCNHEDFFSHRYHKNNRGTGCAMIALPSYK